MAFSKWYRKNRVVCVSSMACLAFLALALYGWGVSWAQMGAFLVISLGLLAGLIGAAALLGWLLARLRR